MRFQLVIAALLLFITVANARRRPLLGSNRCTWGPSYWCQHVGTMKECSGVRGCIRQLQSGEEPKVNARPSDCSQCLTMVQNLRKLAESNFTLPEMRAAGEQLCSAMPQRRQCQLVIDNYLPEVLQLLETGLSETRVCAALSLCGSGRPDPKLRVATFARVPLIRTEQAGSSALCDDCQAVLNSVKKAVEDNQTEAEISAVLKAEICQQLGPLADECGSLVDQYLPQVLQMLDQEIQPKQICTLLGFCTSSRFGVNASVRDFMRSKPGPLGGVECELCESLVNEARALMKDSKTEEEIVDFVKTRVCTLVPAEKDKCIAAVSEYSGIILQLIASELNPQQVCRALGACGSGAFARRHRTMPRVGPQCILCEFVLRELNKLIAGNKTEASIESALESVCSVMPQTIRAECDGFVRRYTPLIVRLIVSDLSPELICSTAGLCASANEEVAQRPRPSTTATACEICETVVTYARALLKENATEEEVLQMIEKVCNFLPTAEQPMCKNFIEQYGAEAIQLLLEEITPSGVCKELGLCSSSLRLRFRSRVWTRRPTELRN